MPTFRRQPTPGDALSRYRDALIRNAPPEELARLAGSLDPELLETLHWTRETGRFARPTPDPQFARRLERDLLQAWPAASHSPSADPPPRTLPAMPRATDRVRAPEPAPPATRTRWPWQPLALVAALVVVLASGLAALRLVGVGEPETQLGAVGAPTTETFVDATVNGAPRTWLPLTVEHWRFQPGGAAATIPALDGPQWIVADGGPVAVTVDGEARTLEPGKALVVPAGQAVSLRNPGSSETSAYRGVAAAGFSFEDYDRAVISKETALNTAAHEAIPPGESRIVFDRLTIPPGTLIQTEATTGQDWFDILTGRLGLALVGDALPIGWSSGRERELTVDDAVPVLVPGTNVTMRNIGDDPLVILRLRVTPLGDDAAAGTPPA